MGRLLETVVPGQYGQPTRLPDMIVSDVAVRALPTLYMLCWRISFGSTVCMLRTTCNPRDTPHSGSCIQMVSDFN